MAGDIKSVNAINSFEWIVSGTPVIKKDYNRLQDEYDYEYEEEEILPEAGEKNVTETEPETEYNLPGFGDMGN